MLSQEQHRTLPILPASGVPAQVPEGVEWVDHPADDAFADVGPRPEPPAAATPAAASSVEEPDADFVRTFTFGETTSMGDVVDALEAVGASVVVGFDRMGGRSFGLILRAWSPRRAMGGR